VKIAHPICIGMPCICYKYALIIFGASYLTFFLPECQIIILRKRENNEKRTDVCVVSSSRVKNYRQFEPDFKQLTQSQVTEEIYILFLNITNPSNIQDNSNNDF
jgi:hypothetical protein